MRTRTPLLIVAIVTILLGIVGLNVAAQRFAPGDAHEEEAAQTQENAANAPETAGQTNALSQLPPDQTLGPPDARSTVVLGWEWTPEVQADPAKLAASIEALRKTAGNARLRIVNTDLVPDAPRGLVVNGKTALEIPPDGMIPPETLARSLSSPSSETEVKR